MAAAWGKIEKIQPTNLNEIMSEEYARDLQSKEVNKYAEHIQSQMQAENKLSELKQFAEPKEAESTGISSEIPIEILEAIKQADIGIDLADEICTSDELIARVLQNQFDHEYNEELKRFEKHKNKQSKVSISFENYKRSEDIESDDSETEEEDIYLSEKKDWDRFETNQKQFEAIPKCGFKVNSEDGKMITKHDSDLCGIRNACKVMSFPPEISTGDAAGFDMKLDNQVFNQLKTHTKHIKKHKMSNRKDNAATAEMGMDAKTKLLLYKLINNQILEKVNGIISTGKEALILHAESDPNYEGDLIIPRECAVKVFKTTLTDFKQRDRYIKDDYRFKDRIKKQNNYTVISMWAEKEMHNLNRMRKCGINCPNVVVLKKHILVMSFIGKHNIAACKLKEAKLSDAQLSCAYEEIVDTMVKLYNEANLVHADLSEYNILWYNEKCWFIDVAQSVEPRHPSALEFLMRDCNNIITFFKRRELPNIMTKEELFEKITELNAQNHNAGILERIHNRGASLLQATAPNLDECPDDKKPLEYPFDVAWEQSVRDKSEISLTNDNIIVENTEALKVISINKPN